MPAITKLILRNFKQFPELEMDFNPTKNVLIGDNESNRPAKSSTQPHKARAWCALKFKWTPVLAF
ncbi:hypothetical protein [Pseudomonas syringae]|uniref:hypothetical protein n=1 Tax=Pseudomonas syringae TaxID=317 RepID=UPI0004641B9E|nr:hypothetical protein [Pseudomonas syringae]